MLCRYTLLVFKMWLQEGTLNWARAAMQKCKVVAVDLLSQMDHWVNFTNHLGIETPGPLPPHKRCNGWFSFLCMAEEVPL